MTRIKTVLWSSLYLVAQIFFSVIPAHADDVPTSPRLLALSSAISAGDRGAADIFWREVTQSGTPMIELPSDTPTDMLVTFLWRAQPGQEQVNVGVAPNGLVVTDQDNNALRRLDKTDVWYKTFRLLRKARFTYSLAWPQGEKPRTDVIGREPDKNGILVEYVKDPLARLSYSGEFNPGVTSRLSYVEGPDALPEPFVVERKGVRRGKVETIEVESRILSNRRKISIYTPPGYSAKSDNYGLLLVFDREAYLSAVPTPTILDNMLADRVIPPVVAILVSSPDRGKELPPSPAFQRFLREELIPLIRARYHISTDPRRAVVAGSSYGGLAAMYTAFTSPDIFGNVVSQSGSYWWDPEVETRQVTDEAELPSDAGWLIKELALAPAKPVKLYMDVGLWEGALQLLPNRILHDVLRGKGYDVAYREFTGGHDYLNWRGTLSDGLMAVIGTTRAKSYLNSHLP